MERRDVVKIWKKWLIDVDKTETDIAKEEGISQATLNEKFRKGTVPFYVFANILERHGYKFVIVETGTKDNK